MTGTGPDRAPQGDFREKNLRVLRERFPALARTLRETPPAPDWSLTAAPTGDPVLALEGRAVHSARDPRREAARLAASLPEASGPVLILGFALGYTAEAVAERFPARPLIVAESRKELFALALECRDLGAFFARKNPVFVLGPETSGAAVTEALRLFPGKVSVLKNRALCERDAWYGEAERQTELWSAREEVNAATLRRFGKRWARNLGANLDAIRDLPGVSCLAGILPPEIPVFLAAAGPSLDRIAPLLPEIKKRAAIVTVDTALRFFLRHHVEPDFVLAVDGQFYNMRHLHRMETENSCLILDLAVWPAAMRLRAGRRFLCASRFPPGKFVEERVDPKGNLGAGGSVATAAWDFSRLLGTGSIWIAGLDLAYPERRSHYRGAFFEEQALAESWRFLPAETRSVRLLGEAGLRPAPAWNGGTTLTDRRLSLYAAWFERNFRSRGPLENRRLAGADWPAGLVLAGLETAPPEQFLALPERRDAIDALLRRAFRAVDRDFSGDEERAARARRHALAVESLKTGLEAIARAADRAAAPENRETPANIEAVERLLAESEVREAAEFLYQPPDRSPGARDPEVREHGPHERCRALAAAARSLLSCLRAPSPA